MYFCCLTASLATFWRKNGISGKPRLVPGSSGALLEWAWVLPRAVAVPRGYFCSPRVPYGFIHASGLPKLFPC